MTFKKLYDSTYPAKCKLHIQKFNDMIYLQSFLFMLQIEQNQKLTTNFPRLKLCGDSHNYFTRSATRNIYNALLSKTEMYRKCQ